MELSKVERQIIVLGLGIASCLIVYIISMAIGDFWGLDTLNVNVYVVITYLILLCVLFILVDIRKSYSNIDRVSKKYICVREAIFVCIIFIVGILAFIGICILLSHILPFSFNELFFITSLLPIFIYSLLFFYLCFLYNDFE